MLLSARQRAKNGRHPGAVTRLPVTRFRSDYRHLSFLFESTSAGAAATMLHGLSLTPISDIRPPHRRKGLACVPCYIEYIFPCRTEAGLAHTHLSEALHTLGARVRGAMLSCEGLLLFSSAENYVLFGSRTKQHHAPRGTWRCCVRAASCRHAAATCPHAVVDVPTCRRLVVSCHHGCRRAVMPSCHRAVTPLCRAVTVQKTCNWHSVTMRD